MVNTAATKLDVRYAPYLQTTLDVFENATTLTGGNPCIIYFHGGSWSQGSKEDLNNSGTGKAFFSYAFDQHGNTGFAEDEPINFVGVNYRMFNYDSPSGGSTARKTTCPAYMPEMIEDAGRAIQWVRDHAVEYNLNPSLPPIVMGFSAGGHLAMMNAFGQSMPFTERDMLSHVRYNYQSRTDDLAGVVNVQGLADLKSENWVWNNTVNPFGGAGGLGGRFQFGPYGIIESGNITTGPTTPGDGAPVWNNMPRELQRAMSPIEVARENLSGRTGLGVYQMYDQSVPGGPNATNDGPISASAGWQDLHDWGQGPVLQKVLQANKLKDEKLVYVTMNDWKDVSGGADAASQAISAPLYQWCLDQWGL